MPPKPKFTKEDIINAAFELARKNGIDAVAAREVGKALGVSSSPIFTFFSGMDELKAEVVKRAGNELAEYMNGIFDYRPAFKEFGMRWVHFAIAEPNLYRMLFHPEQVPGNGLLLKGSELFEPIFAAVLQEIRNSFGLSDEEAGELMNQMLLHANGIAGFSLRGSNIFTDEMISRSISEVCIGLVISAKLRDGSFDPEIAAVMAQSAVAAQMPKKIR